MPIAFEGVGYSYDPAQSKKKADKNGNSVEGRLWGNDPSATWALRDITFTVDDGEFFGIAGHTGSGKSTLIQHMNGLLSPTEGTVLLDGFDLAQRGGDKNRRFKVGLVFQYPEQQLFASTVYEDIAFGPRKLGLGESEMEDRVREALEQVNLDFESLREKSPFSLSSGQQRRVAIAGILAMKPEILVLDEPTAGLDPAAREDLLGLIAQFHEQGLTIVLVSHRMGVLARLCDRILVLNKGRLALIGTPDDVFGDAEALRRIGLGVPGAQRIANSLRASGINLPGGLYDIDRLTDEVAKLSLEKGCGG